MKKKYKIVISLILALSMFLGMVVSAAAVTDEAILALLSEEEETDLDVTLSGLPSFITSEMLVGALTLQQEYGHPASVCIAQIIAESGFGLYGPGGNEGMGLSGLAYNYKNLFGIKYSSIDSNATGSVNLSTGEQTSAGDSYTIVAGFAVYPSYTASITQRSVILSRSRYASKVGEYLNKNDGNYTKSEAKSFAQGVKDGGWATDISYVTKLVKLMDQYDLYRLDNMKISDLESLSGSYGSYSGNVTPIMQKVVEIAKNNTGTKPCTAGYCAAWVSGVYQAAGLTYPGGNAIDMWNSWKSSGSTSMDNIPPGAIVCGSGSGSDGAKYGHVGIYLGDGLVANNVGYHKIETLESWISWQKATCQGHKGWIGWVWPRGQALDQ